MLPGPGSDQFLLGSRRRNEIRVTDEAELNIDAISAQVGEYLDWSKRVPAVGAHIPPGETISITLGIEPTTTGSSTSDVEVLYHDGGSRFELRTNLALKIKVPPARCF